MSNSINVKQIRDFGSIITDTFQYIRQHYKTLGKSILYFVVPLIVVAGVLLSQYFGQSFDMAVQDIPSGPFLSEMMMSAFAGMLFAILAMTALAAVVYNHMKLVADDNIDSQNIQTEDIWEGYKSDFFMLLLLSIGVFFATFFGFLFLVIPGIFISVKLTLVATVYVIEDRSFEAAFSRSWNLITNHWWFTFGLVLVMSLLVSMISYAVSMPFMIASAFSGFAGLDDPQSMGSVFTIFYGLVTSLNYVFYVVLYLSIGLHYFNLVERKEGRGLQQRIEQINKSEKPANNV